MTGYLSGRPGSQRDLGVASHCEGMVFPPASEQVSSAMVGCSFAEYCVGTDGIRDQPALKKQTESEDYGIEDCATVYRLHDMSADTSCYAQK